MSLLDPNNPTGPLGFIFGAKPASGIPTYEQLQMRRKIAQSLLGQRSRFPKTFGEGLSAIGEAIGDRVMMNKLDAMEQAKEADVGPEYNKMMGASSPVSAPPTGRPMSYVPEDAGTPLAATSGNVPSWNQFAQEESPGGLGLAPAQAAGLVGNLQAESGAGINPNAPPGDAGTAFGSAQWRGPRLAALQQYAAKQGLDPMTTAAQQGFMRQEMIGQGNKMPTEGGAYAGLTATNTPAEAATAVDRLYERSSGEHRGRRINNAQKIMQSYGAPGVGPQSSVIDPGLNQSVALNQTEPPAPAGPPMAFSGAPASDAPPVGMPIAGQAPPSDARAAIAGAITPKPQPVVAPPVPPPPAGPQIAQAPPPQQIRVPEKEPVPPQLQTNPQLREIAVLSGKLGPDDPRQAGLRLRYQQLQAIDEATNAQKLEEYKYKRKRYDEAPETAAALSHIQAQTRKEAIIDEPQSKYFQTGPGTVSPLQIEGAPNNAPPLPKNEAQLKAMKHYEQMEEANKIIGEGKALRNGPSAVGSQVPIVGGFLQTDAYRKERSAAERWVINKLRPESGAVLSEKEIDREVRSYFPLPSDDAKTIADKTAARKIANEGMMEASGREGKTFLEWKNKQAAAAETKSKAELGDAVQWLKDNPNDPRAPAVRKRLGL